MIILKLGLIELITYKHESESPGSTRSNKKNNAIDDIWGSPGLATTSCGYLPVNYGLKSDHRLIWVKYPWPTPWQIRLSRQKHHRPENFVSIIRRVSRNTSPISDTFPDNTTCFLGSEILKITKNVLPYLEQSRSNKKSKNPNQGKIKIQLQRLTSPHEQCTVLKNSQSIPTLSPPCHPHNTKNRKGGKDKAENHHKFSIHHRKKMVPPP